MSYKKFQACGKQARNLCMQNNLMESGVGELKKKIKILFGVCALFALVWAGAKNPDVFAEKSVSSDEVEENESKEDKKGEENKETPEKSLRSAVKKEARETAEKETDGETPEETEEETSEETAEENPEEAREETPEESQDETEEDAPEENTEEGLLYTLRTADGNNLGMVPIVSGSAVVLLDGSSPRIYQGEYVPEGTEAFQLKMEEVTEQAAAEGKIRDWAFYRESLLKTFEWPEGVESIGRFAFARSGLEKIEIPDGVTTIEDGAFYHCDNLQEVILPESVTEIGEHAFEHTPWYEKQLTETQEEQETDTD